jgi:zinc D-Ala-D-Ala carboxypeptidase
MSDLVMDCPRCWGKKCDLCKQTGKVPDEQLSPHFKLSEMLNSGTGRAKGISNEPTPEVVANLRKLCNEALEPIRAVAGPLKINSGFRADAINQAVGGSITSAHSYGLAADLNPVKGTWKELMDKVLAAKIPLDQVIFEHTWVHVGLLHPKTLKQRGDKLSMFKVDGKTVYEPYNPNDKRFA